MRTSGPKVRNKKLARSAIKQVADEPFEILKTAKKQLRSTEAASTDQPQDVSGDGPTKKEPVDEAKLKVRSARSLEALEKEIEDIRQAKKQKEEERRQMEKMEQQRVAKEQEQTPLVEPTSKRKRGLMHGVKGMKGKLGRLKRKAEIRMPPSG